MCRTRCDTGPSWSSKWAEDVSSTQADRHLFATGSATVANLLRGEVRPATVLGAFPTAMYLRVASGDVIALLTRDAVRLPLGLRLSTRSAEDPLDRCTGHVRVGSDQVQVGEWSVRLSREVSVTAPTGLEPNRLAVEYASRRLARVQVELRPGSLDVLLSHQRVLAPAGVVRHFLGVGPGLTPSGDDILAGFLVGDWSFGNVDTPLRTAVLDAAPAGTTDLSAALLRCASRGESIPEVSAFLEALAESTPAATHLLDAALVELGHVGHTSGTALAAGALAAARVAVQAVDAHREAGSTP